MNAIPDSGYHSFGLLLLKCKPTLLMISVQHPLQLRFITSKSQLLCCY
ncbi:Uncharacterised protein [Yersinia enterocolitica]|nr:Uncharacterised protein [Yersinia enterocolitica]